MVGGVIMSWEVENDPNAQIGESAAKGQNTSRKWLRYVGISWINSYLYCPYKIYLSRVRKIRVAPTVEMVAGIERHLELEIIHEEMAEEVMSVDEAMERAPVEGITFIFREVEVRGLLPYAVLCGYIDELHVGPESILIIDDKPGDVPYYGNRMQVWGYALAFKLEYEPAVPIYGALRNRDTGDMIWREEFSDAAEGRVKGIIGNIVDILEGWGIPPGTSNLRKCARCMFREVCERVVKWQEWEAGEKDE